MSRLPLVTAFCGLSVYHSTRASHVPFPLPVSILSVYAPLPAFVPVHLLLPTQDVRLFREFFNIRSCSYADMSPVILPAGYTKKYLDGHISEDSQIEAVQSSFDRVSTAHDFTVVEGTGHAGVGSIVNLDNARVAAMLGLDMVLVANGGLGSTYDQLSLNMLKCKQHDVHIKAVIINKVIPDKVDMVREYMGKALARDGIPLAGADNREWGGP